jgi:hypothetical protein
MSSNLVLVLLYLGGLITPGGTEEDAAQLMESSSYPKEKQACSSSFLAARTEHFLVVM